MKKPKKRAKPATTRGRKKVKDLALYTKADKVKGGFFRIPMRPPTATTMAVGKESGTGSTTMAVGEEGS